MIVELKLRVGVSLLNSHALVFINKIHFCLHYYYLSSFHTFLFVLIENADAHNVITTVNSAF